MSNIVDQARLFAHAAHAAAGNTRAYINQPYIVHPTNVVKILLAQKCDEKTIAIGWLHDVLEDTSVTAQQLADHFPGSIVQGVGFLTVPPKEEFPDRAERLQVYNDRLSSAPDYVKTVKLADIMDNCSSLSQFDPDRARRYFPEKLKSLDYLTGADPHLFALVKGVLENLQ